MDEEDWEPFAPTWDDGTLRVEHLERLRARAAGGDHVDSAATMEHPPREGVGWH